ncbi:MAG: WD40 repeat domain-containing protein [Anaerolineales bacterium]|nr:WD40 repeat domain-containing protein [Anaerolineales bacterium]
MTANKKWILLWAAIRLPVLAITAYIFRYSLISWIENTFSFFGSMLFLVFTVSTLPARLAVLFIAATGFSVFYLILEKISVSPFVKYFIFLIGIFAGVYFSFTYLFLVPSAISKAALITVLFALNAMPYEQVSKSLKAQKWTNPFFLASIGIAEALFPQTYILWLINIIGAKSVIQKWAWTSGIVTATSIWIMLFVPYDNQRILTLTEHLYANPSVEKFSTSAFNWIELNPAHQTLYAVGRGTNFLLSFDTANLNIPPERSHEDIGKTQSFGFNPKRQELYVYKGATHELLYMDALTKNILNRIPVPNLSPGDVWVRWIPLNDTIILSSEADSETGIPLYVFERDTGEIVASMDFPVIPTAYLLAHPKKPLLYFNSFKDPYFAVWDMETQQLIEEVQITPRTDRMVFLERENEIWIASPMEGAILRYDASTLNAKGFIRSSFGVRTLAVDPERNLLITGNFLNGRITVQDLNTEKKTASYYLAPWIRTIELDTVNGYAYISTLQGLFQVKYIK